MSHTTAIYMMSCMRIRNSLYRERESNKIRFRSSEVERSRIHKGKFQKIFKKLKRIRKQLDQFRRQSSFEEEKANFFFI